MYLSNLLINVGDNPDRPRPGRLWLRNLYRVHQRLCMAFPSAQRKQSDAQFLDPYNPTDFAQRQVHTPRNPNAGFLFRIDPQPGGNVVILTLSAIEPDWDYAFANAQYLLAAPPQCKPYAPNPAAGRRLRFRLLVNAVSRARQQSVHRSGQAIDEKWVGKRIGVASDDASLRNWIDRRALTSGFEITDLTSAQAGYVFVNKTGKSGQGYRLRSVRYEGTLQVLDAAIFRGALLTGIGPAKAFGFGLLSVAPIR
ncbi:MAG: type I-E CRISPR-associated protein Cas6/Cse3/CasE [Phycisphaerales bacterium]|nr:type I-E CRISPR-associated protein Cas6/Cse3/CasE [Phycisphaerales bacterium]